MASVLFQADPLGIIFSQLEVVGCYSGSVAEACREILPGDFLIQFDGHEVPNFGRLTELVKAKSSVKMGGHDPNALIVTELVFAEPFPHRDRSLQVMQETDDDPVSHFFPLSSRPTPTLTVGKNGPSPTHTCPSLSHASRVPSPRSHATRSHLPLARTQGF